MQERKGEEGIWWNAKIEGLSERELGILVAPLAQLMKNVYARLEEINNRKTCEQVFF